MRALTLPEALDTFDDGETVVEDIETFVGHPTPGPPRRAAAARTETATYHFPPVHNLPPLSELTRADLLELAAENATNCGSELLCAGHHVSALCQLVLELAQEAQDAISARKAAEHELLAHRVATLALLQRLPE